MPRKTTEDESDELVFLSPEESFPEESPGEVKDQGASPVLRRSNRKRKSTSASVTDMSKGSSTKKKKTSPGKENDPGKNMLKIPRTPQQGQSQEGQGHDPGPKEPTAGFEALLLAMEGRLTARLRGPVKRPGKPPNRPN